MVGHSERDAGTAICATAIGVVDGVISQTPPQSGWLDEWGRLKGGHLLSLGVALKARLC